MERKETDLEKKMKDLKDRVLKYEEDVSCSVEDLEAELEETDKTIEEYKENMDFVFYESSSKEENDIDEKDNSVDEKINIENNKEWKKSDNHSTKKKESRRKLWKILFCYMAAFIVIICGVFLYNRYSYSDKPADMTSYLNILSEDGFGIILNSEIDEQNAKIIENAIYLNYNFVHQKLNSRIYWDNNEKLLIFTTPTEMMTVTTEEKMKIQGIDRSESEKNIFHIEGAQIYISLDYLMKHTDLEYAVYQEPNYIYLRTEWEACTQYELKKDSAIRVRGGVKSPVVSPVQKGESVRLILEGENWSVVQKENGLMGYIKNKDLINRSEMVPQHNYEAAVYENITSEKPVVLAWHQITVSEENKKIKDILSKTKNITTVAPTWFVLSDNEGNIEEKAEHEYVDYVHKQGMQVWAVVNNIDIDTNLEQILSYTSKRTYLIGNIMDKLKEYDIDGINVDFELVPEDLAEEYIEFLRELSIECRKQNRILSIDNYVPFSYNEYYNREEQGIIADYVVIMAYDEHYAGSEEGSVSSINYVREGIEKTLEEVPAEKIICGIPFYTRVWKNGVGKDTDSTAIGMKSQAEILKEKKLTPTWIEELGQNYVFYEEDEQTCKIWMEDADSIEEKMKVIREKKIAGVACWKLGFETEEIWDIIRFEE